MILKNLQHKEEITVAKLAKDLDGLTKKYEKTQREDGSSWMTAEEQVQLAKNSEETPLQDTASKKRQKTVDQKDEDQNAKEVKFPGHIDDLNRIALLLGLYHPAKLDELLTKVIANDDKSFILDNLFSHDFQRWRPMILVVHSETAEYYYLKGERSWGHYPA